MQRVVTRETLRAWKQLTQNPKELNLEKTLFSGQAFRWRKVEIPQEGIVDSLVTRKPQSTIYSCVLSDLKMKDKVVAMKEPVFVVLRQRNETGVVEFTTIQDSSVSDHDLQTLLCLYFQLDVSLLSLWSGWMKDKNFAEKGPSFEGLRVCRQPQIENIFSFICSSNNNIKRISGMIDSLCKKYGTLVCTTKLEKDGDGIDFYSFPSVDQLLATGNLEQELRDLGFGYRAKYIHGTALFLSRQEDGYLERLLEMKYQDCRIELLKLPGVGPKVADCISLFSCCKHAVIPVDTHVLQIATRDYNVSVKNLNAKTYLLIGDAFRDAFGEFAGWAHSVLFSADLKPASNPSAAPKSKGSKKRKAEVLEESTFTKNNKL